MSDNRPNVYWEGKKLIIRASALGRCMGELVRTGIGMEPAPAPEDMKRRWAEGVVAEPQILEWLRGQGLKVSNDGPDNQLELEISVGNVVLRCHPDGVAVKVGEDSFPEWARVIEAKALRPSMRAKPFPPYDWQMSAEMAASGLPGLWVYGEKGEDGQLTGKFEIVEQDEPVYSLTNIKKRLLAIYKAVCSNTVPECDWKQYPCGFYREEDSACGQKGKADGKHELPELPVPESVVQAYVVAKRVAEDAKKDYDEAQKHLKKMLLDGAESGYRIGQQLVATKKPGRKSYDYKAMTKDGVELDKYAKVGSEFWEIREVDKS